MKRLAFAIVALTLPFSFAACDVDESTTSDTSTYQPSDPGGMGMTYNGKIGTDMGGGFVLPYDGSGPQLGYGF